jgi:threonine dehydratase
LSVTLKEIEEARSLLATRFAPTPTLKAPTLTEAHGRDVLLKAENLQRTGSFKIRGAWNRISRLGGPAGCPGVVCASAGNHAQGVGLAAKMTGLPATIVMPVETPLIKVDRTRSHGAEVVLHGDSYEDAFTRAREIGRERGLTFVHAFEDAEVIAGQGTAGLEILDQAKGLGAVVVPVGGGGLIAGISIAIKASNPGVRVYGVQAAGAAPSAASLRSDRLVDIDRADTIADAIRFRTASAVTMPILRRYVDDIVTVSEEEISEAVVKLMEEAKLVVEGAGAVPLAALMAGRIPHGPGGVVLVLSGGNIDLNLIARVLEQGLSRANRYLVLKVRVPDRPGRLHRILSHLSSHGVNVLDVVHRRAGWMIPLGQVEIEFLVETRDAAHGGEILDGLRTEGYSASRGEADRSSRE